MINNDDINVNDVDNEKYKLPLTRYNDHDILSLCSAVVD